MEMRAMTKSTPSKKAAADEARRTLDVEFGIVFEFSILAIFQIVSSLAIPL
jgi:hypothetical protein